MTIIKTRRHPVKFYITLLIGSLLLNSIGSVMIFAGLKENTDYQDDKSIFILALFGVLFCLLSFWILYAYLKNSPIITIDKNHIKIGKQTYRLSSIRDVILTGKMPFRFMLYFPMEGTTILFKNGKEVILYDDMYINTYQIKSFLEQVIIKKQEYREITLNKINSSAIRFERRGIFKGSPFFSLRGISFWSIMFIMAVPIIVRGTSIKLAGFIFIGVFGAFWFLLHAWLMHYFELTNEFLIIRNHIYTWKEKIYNLSDIKEVVFESRGNQPNCMRIITIDFKSKLYPSSTLSDKTWLELEKKLNRCEVQVRNECI